MPMANMSSALNTQAAAALNYGSFPPGMGPYQKNSGTSSSSGYVDPFGDAAYQEWLSSMGYAQQQQQQQQGPVEPPKTIWPGAIVRNSSKQSGHEASMSVVPDYFAASMNQSTGSDQMGISGSAMDDDGCATSLKVPTNTPISAPDGSITATGLYLSSPPSTT